MLNKRKKDRWDFLMSLCGAFAIPIGFVGFENKQSIIINCILGAISLTFFIWGSIAFLKSFAKTE